MTENLLIRWIIIGMVVAAAVASIYVNWGENGPLKMGMAFRGGYSISYSISEESLKDFVEKGESVDKAMDQAVILICSRIKSMGLHEMTIRRVGLNQIVIQVPELSKEERAEINDSMLQLGKQKK